MTGWLRMRPFGASFPNPVPMLKNECGVKLNDRSTQKQGRADDWRTERRAKSLHRNQCLGHDAKQPTASAAGTNEGVPASMLFWRFRTLYLDSRSPRDRTGPCLGGRANGA